MLRCCSTFKASEHEVRYFFRKRPSQAPGVPESVQEVFGFDMVGYRSLRELKKKDNREPDEKGFETEAQAMAFAKEMVGRAR